MFFELIATIVIGLGAAGLAMGLNRLTGRRLPRWIAPVVAGIAMIGFTISNEYTWYGRQSASLPEGFFIVRKAEERVLYRPWTYVIPYVSRFATLDRASIRRNEAVPEQRMADLYVFGRWSPIRQVPILIDCKTGRRADLVDDVRFAGDGRVEDPRWHRLEADDALLSAACEAG